MHQLAPMNEGNNQPGYVQPNQAMPLTTDGPGQQPQQQPGAVPLTTEGGPPVQQQQNEEKGGEGELYVEGVKFFFFCCSVPPFLWAC